MGCRVPLTNFNFNSNIIIIIISIIIIINEEIIVEFSPRTTRTRHNFPR